MQIQNRIATVRERPVWLTAGRFLTVAVRHLICLLVFLIRQFRCECVKICDSFSLHLIHAGISGPRESNGARMKGRSEVKPR